MNGQTGEISFASNSLAAPQCGMLMVTATTGEGTDEGVSISVPVFFNFLAGVAVTSPTATNEKVTIEYTPFVLQANPKKITRSAAPTITGVTDPSKFRLDYRRTFNYYNIKVHPKNAYLKNTAEYQQIKESIVLLIKINMLRNKAICHLLKTKCSNLRHLILLVFNHTRVSRILIENKQDTFIVNI